METRRPMSQPHSPPDDEKHSQRLTEGRSLLQVYTTGSPICGWMLYSPAFSMKARFLLLVTLLVPVLAFAEAAATQLFGHWRWADAARSSDYTFLADGTFTGNLVGQGRTAVEFSGKWSVAADTLRYEYTESTPPRISAGTKDEDKLAEITKDYYVISAQDGSKRTYRRLP